MHAFTRPRTRSTGIVPIHAGDELILHDELRGHMHALNASAASIWKACDGSLSMEQIAARLDLDLSVVEFGVAQLHDLTLLEGGAEHKGISRRDVVRRLAVAGVAGAVMLPAVSSITSQPRAEASPVVSCAGMDGPCATGTDCCEYPNIDCFDGTCLPAG